MSRLAGRLRLRSAGVAGGLLALLVLVAVFGDRGLLDLWRLRRELEALHREVQALEAENERLARAIEQLRHDPGSIERLAREELGLVRPGERVLRFPRSGGGHAADEAVGPPGAFPDGPAGDRERAAGLGSPRVPSAPRREPRLLVAGARGAAGEARRRHPAPGAAAPGSGVPGARSAAEPDAVLGVTGGRRRASSGRGSHAPAS